MKLSNLIKYLLFLSPTLVLAQGFDLFGLSEFILEVINDTVVFLLFALAVLFFLFHVVKFIYYGNDKGKREESKKYMIYGIIVLTIMFTIYAVIGLVAETFGISNFGIPQFGN